jgi:hypothetical protein
MKDMNQLKDFGKGAPWGALWALAIGLMFLTIISALLDGWSVREAITLGLFNGPGFGVVAIIISFIGWFFHDD